MMNVIWYNTTKDNYQAGSWKDFNKLKATSTNPESLLILERFRHEPFGAIQKIARELNKCR